MSEQSCVVIFSDDIQISVFCHQTLSTHTYQKRMRDIVYRHLNYSKPIKGCGGREREFHNGREISIFWFFSSLMILARLSLSTSRNFKFQFFSLDVFVLAFHQIQFWRERLASDFILCSFSILIFTSFLSWFPLFDALQHSLNFSWWLQLRRFFQ